MSPEDFVFLKAKLAKIGHHRLKILSDSMEPILKVNHEYRVEFCSFGDLKTFDIVVFLEGRKLMSHFLWFKSESFEHWISKSYRYPTQLDSPITEQNYLGVIRDPKISKVQRCLFSWRAYWRKST